MSSSSLISGVVQQKCEEAAEHQLEFIFELQLYGSITVDSFFKGRTLNLWHHPAGWKFTIEQQSATPKISIKLLTTCVWRKLGGRIKR